MDSSEPAHPIDLGATRRNILISLGAILTFIGLLSTFLFQQISKRDNNLRQRGRYLVTLQGYSTTVFLSVICFYQAYKYQFPCFILYYGAYFGLVPFVLCFTGRAWRLIARIDRNNTIYKSRFAEPDDLANLDDHLDSTPKSLNPFPPTSDHSDENSSTHAGDLSDPSLAHQNTTCTAPTLVGVGGVLDDDCKLREKSELAGAVELTHQSPEEIAQFKKWYNRYRSATEQQMRVVGLLYMGICAIFAFSFQFNTPGIAIYPMQLDCHSGPEYHFPYLTTIVFLFVIAPLMVYQLRGANDGFGIRSELKFISIFSAPCYLMFFVLPKVNYEITKRILDKTTFMAMILIASHIPSVILPLVRHFKEYSHECPYTARALQRRNRRANGTENMEDVNLEDASSSPTSESVKTVVDEDGILSDPNSIVLADSTTFTHEPASGQGPTVIQMSNILMSPPAAKTKFSTSDQFNQHHSGYPDRNSTASLDYDSESPYPASSPNIKSTPGSPLNVTFKNILKNGKRQRFRLGGRGDQAYNINSKRTDWDEFIRTIENRQLFDRMSAFTVGEFCAENTRFLYEVSRLEKRATQYERIRSLAMATQDHLEDPESRHPSSQAASTNNNPTPPFDPSLESVHSNKTTLSKSPSTSTARSVVPPLPTQFSVGRMDSTASALGAPPRIKKIVSVSSVSSTKPMLAIRRSTSSIYDESEPSSPMSPLSPPNALNGPLSGYRLFGGSATAISDLESSGSRSKGTVARGATSTSLQTQETSSTTPAVANEFDPLPMPPTLLMQFEYVYRIFISHGGRLELNLSYDTATDIHQKAARGEWRSGMFDGAVYEVQELLFRDVWPKFVTSSHGLNYDGVRPTIRGIGSLSGNASPSNGSVSGSIGRRGEGSSVSGSGRNSSVLMPSDLQAQQQQQQQQPQQVYSQRPTSTPSVAMSSPKSSLSRTASRTAASTGELNVHTGATTLSQPPLPRVTMSRNGSVGSARTRDEDEESSSSRNGFRSWLSKTNRTGITAAALISREGPSEESLGIIEQSRKSTADRRSDNSGQYLTSHPSLQQQHYHGATEEGLPRP